VSGLDDATREDLLALIGVQQRIIDELRAEVAELKRRVGMNSSNSSNPPSSDGPGAARKAKAPRGKSGRKPGKQPGTPGSTLGWAADPRVVDHVPASCGGCGCDLSGAPGAGVVRRQVVDIPEVSAFAVEHRLHKRRCACGRTTTAPAPEGVDAPVQYGANLRALACYLVVFQHVPAERAALLIADVTGARVSTGWVARTVARTAGLLADTEAFIKTLLTLAHVLHVDETSTSIAGNTQWLHVACTDTLTAYHLHPSRGLVAVGAFGVLPVFAGTVVHDSLAQYRPENFPLSRHALCGAHIIRELTAAAEADRQQIWPGQAIFALTSLNSQAHRARERGQGFIAPSVAAFYTHLWDQAVLVGLANNPRAPGREQSKTRNLLDRLVRRRTEVLRFSVDLTCPFTNNQGERDLRPAKTQLKISGCHRSTTGAGAWLTIRGYISAARKHSTGVMTALRDAVTGNPWTPPLPT
jgi:transposase